MRVHVTVNEDRCVGAGQCALSASEVFTQREDDGKSVVLKPYPDDEQLAVAREIAWRLCPSGAVRLVTETD